MQKTSNVTELQSVAKQERRQPGGESSITIAFQLDGFVDDIMPLDPLPEKWRAYKWHTIELDGHSIPALQVAFTEAAATKGKPTAIIAHTIKGKGVSFMENNPKFHGTAPAEDEMTKALVELA
jgi:transketolase